MAGLLSRIWPPGRDCRSRRYKPAYGDWKLGGARRVRGAGQSGVGRPAAVGVRGNHPLDPSQPDDAPARLEHIDAIESCYSVAGEESYVLLVRVPSPRALEELLQLIRTTANVRTRSTIILQTFYDGRQLVP